MGCTKTGNWQSREIKGQGHWGFEEVGENIVGILAMDSKANIDMREVW